MPTLEDVVLKVACIEEIAKRDKSEAVQKAAERAKENLSGFDKALKNNKIYEAERIAETIHDLWESTCKLDDLRCQKKQWLSWNWWSIIGLTALIIISITMICFLNYFIKNTSTQTLMTIEGVRPLLVIAAILSTIIFGGALILTPLFSSEGSLDERFRRAREIFLVFSGVFGTVMGFYFGAGESNGPQVSIAATLEDENVIAYAAGGIPPYIIGITYGQQELSKAEETDKGWISYAFDKKKDAIIPLSVSVTDSKGRHAQTTVELSEEQLKKDGWVTYGGGPNGQVNSETSDMPQNR